jgi:uncharacterized protein (TIGR02145 family)
MKTYSTIVIGLFLLVFISCTKETPKTLPTLTATAVTKITENSAKSGGEVVTDGGAEVTARGICWSSKNTNPTTSDSKTTDGAGLGLFVSSIEGLSAGTTYNIRSYATNSVGTSYYSLPQFTTLVVVPAITTTEISAITATSFKSGGSITTDGGSPITARGVIWSSTNTIPAISEGTTSDGTGVGSFISSVSGLTPGFTYNVRAYAKNSAGTAYGNVIVTKTSASVPVVESRSISNITPSTVSISSNVTYDGGVNVTSRGVCWSTTSNPTTSDSKTTDGAGTGIYASSVTGLTYGTTYYFRSYATNSTGTGYSSEFPIKTLANLPDVSTSGISVITITTATGGGAIISDGGAAIKEMGVCLSTSQNPTIANTKVINGVNAIGNFTCGITSLIPGTTYYLKAFATNSTGTAYGAQVNFTTISPIVSDMDGNIYNSTTIGSQVWMASNLKTTKYKDGTVIPLVTSTTAWANLKTPGYCWYNNDATNKNIYGAMYNWYTVKTGNLCPTGWHVPSDAEWKTTLATHIGSTKVDGGKMKETGTSHWLSPNVGATNETKFTALPGGYRSQLNSTFWDIKSYGYWWTSTEYITWETAFHWYMGYNDIDVHSGADAEGSGLSVRCVKD